MNVADFLYGQPVSPFRAARITAASIIFNQKNGSQFSPVTTRGKISELHLPHPSVASCPKTGKKPRYCLPAFTIRFVLTAVFSYTYQYAIFYVHISITHISSQESFNDSAEFA